MEFIDFTEPKHAGKWAPRAYFEGYHYLIKCSFQAALWTGKGNKIVDEKHKWLMRNLRRANGEKKRYTFLVVELFSGQRFPNHKIGVLFLNKEDAMAFKLAFEE